MTVKQNPPDAAEAVWPDGASAVWSPYRNPDEPPWREPESAPPAQESVPQDPAYNALIFAGRMAHERFSRGELAELRRLDIRAPDSPVYYRWMSEKELGGSPWRERQWALILAGLAHMTRSSGRTFEERCAHNLDTEVGQALYQGNRAPGGPPFYSAIRLNSLLRARRETRDRLLLMLFRQCASERVRFNWWEMARFILYGDNEGPAAERNRRTLAWSYYQAEDRAMSRQRQDSAD